MVRRHPSRSLGTFVAVLAAVAGLLAGATTDLWHHHHEPAAVSSHEGGGQCSDRRHVHADSPSHEETCLACLHRVKSADGRVRVARVEGLAPTGEATLALHVASRSRELRGTPVRGPPLA